MASFRLVAALAALFAASGVPAQTVPRGTAGELAVRLLAEHNKERAAVGAPPLQWDATLAAHAASYGPVLAGLRRLVHSPREGRPGERENLEPDSYLFPGTSRTGNWEDIAHYTQIVWPTTTYVGCAVYSADWDYLICRYSPPGNKDGKPIFVNASLALGR